MGFTPPPTLPDYNKLDFMLNDSGVQQWNPAVYDILRALIQAVKKSQNVITKNGASSVIVDPHGALNGDGTTDNPLAVRVDGSTITINASDQLVAGGSSGPVLYTNITLAASLWTNGISVNLIAAPGVGIFLVPIAAVIVIHKPGATFENAPIPSFTFPYSSNGTWASGIAPGTGAGWSTWYSYLTINQFTDFTNARDNQGLTILPNLAGGAWFPNATGVFAQLGILYTLQNL